MTTNSEQPTIREILSDFLDGHAAEEAWIDAEAAINQLVVNELESIANANYDDMYNAYDVDGIFDTLFEAINKYKDSL
jgi:hypothetical protein